MDKPTKETGISAQVLEKIRSGRVKMRPRWHFGLLAALGATGGALAALTLLYLASLIIFNARQSGAWFAPSFGFSGWYVLLTSLPWLLVALAAAFAVVLELLVRHYAFAYRRPLLYSLLGVVLLAIAGGLLVSRTGLHPGLMRYTERHRIPVAGTFYRTIRHPRLRPVYRGQLAATTSDGFLIRGWRGETVRVFITVHTRLPFGQDFSVGDVVVVFGERSNGEIQAFGVRKISP